MAKDMGGIQSKPTTDAYRRGFDGIRWRKCGPRRGRVVIDHVSQPAEGRGGRARLFARKTKTPAWKMDPEVKRAVRVLGLAESKPERDMFESMLRNEGKLASPDAIREARTEVQIRRGF